jgi:hypothetical protein
MADVNLLPFSSRAAFCAGVVLALKNFSQFAVICATALALLEPAGADELAAGAEPAGAEAGDEAAELAGDVAADVPELLLQAATATARARPSARAMIRRAKRSNRMTRLLVSVGGRAAGSHYGGIGRIFSECAPNVTFGAASYPAQPDAGVRECAQAKPAPSVGVSSTSGNV